MNSIIIDDDEISIEIIKSHAQNTAGITITDTFTSAIEAKKYLDENKCDLIFLDINMPQMNGFEFMQMIGNKLPNVILITSHEEFAIEAFKFNVVGYLLKPVKYYDFVSSIKKIDQNFNKTKSTIKKENATIFIKEGKSIIKVNKDDIIYIQSMGDYAKIHTIKKDYTIHSTMKSLETKFSTDKFIRVHRSYIIRISSIEDIEDDTICVLDKIIPIGKTYKKDVYSKINIF
mgnify:CR=1 FL=1